MDEGYAIMLETENTTLKLENAQLRGQIYRLRHLPGIFKRLRIWWTCTVERISFWWFMKKIEAGTELQDWDDGIDYDAPEPEDGEFQDLKQ